MNLKHATPEQIEDLYLPSEALDALRDGVEWEFQPDSTEGAGANIHWCNDCRTWHQTWSVWGLRLDADGALYEVVWTVDSDGDWGDGDEYPYGTFDHDLDRAQRRAAWREYYRYVVDNNGDDPVEEFIARSGPERVTAALRLLNQES